MTRQLRFEEQLADEIHRFVEQRRYKYETASAQQAAMDLLTTMAVQFVTKAVFSKYEELCGKTKRP